jgi:hypothetical protein
VIVWYKLSNGKGYEICKGNVTHLYRSGTQSTVPRGSARYKLDLVDVREFRWDKGGTVSVGDYIFSKVKKKIINYWQQILENTSKNTNST